MFGLIQLREGDSTPWVSDWLGVEHMPSGSYTEHLLSMMQEIAIE